jgi:hypothetical protein
VRQTFDAQTASLRQRRPLGLPIFLCKNSVHLRHVTPKGAVDADSPPCCEPATEPYLAASVEQRGDRNGLMQTGKTIALSTSADQMIRLFGSLEPATVFLVSSDAWLRSALARLTNLYYHQSGLSGLPYAA